MRINKIALKYILGNFLKRVDKIGIDSLLKNSLFNYDIEYEHIYPYIEVSITLKYSIINLYKTSYKFYISIIGETAQGIIEDQMKNVLIKAIKKEIGG